MLDSEKPGVRMARPQQGDLRIGFVPLCDCAPLVMAYELGLFAARGLRVALSREVGWATVRDKIVLRELDAAHAPAAMVLAISQGIGSFKMPCATGLILNLHGNGITLSNRLWASGVRDAPTLCQFVRSRRNGAPLTFGVAFSCSSHSFLLQKWLRAGGLAPVRDVNIAVVPPPQMAVNLKAGHLDGYCVGEPWNSLAVFQRAGWVAELSPAIAPHHPEKVLLVLEEFARTRAEAHEQLIAALFEACQFCQRLDNREHLVEILARPEYLDTNPAVLRNSLCGPFRFSKERIEPNADLHVFAGPDVNEPGLDKAVWARLCLAETGPLANPALLNQKRLLSVFRSDLFLAATQSKSSQLNLPPGGALHAGDEAPYVGSGDLETGSKKA
jgi:ABC-type nitrate/sulfonate/bicarbonate transport system substrate-binding protein